MQTTGKNGLLLGLAGLLLLGGGGAWFLLTRAGTDTKQHTEAEASLEEVKHFCGGCHAYPPPESFPRETWREHVEVGYNFFHRFQPNLTPPERERVARYYEKRAPEELALPDRSAAEGKATISWKANYLGPRGGSDFPGVTNVNLVKLKPDGKTQILVCECEPLSNQGQLLLCDPHAKEPTWTVLARIPSAARAEVLDLDGDGTSDILVACLGSFFPTDEKVGSVLWLRGQPDGKFEPITLLKNVGRVADVRAGDFNADGKLDLIVAEFGWNGIGSVLHLENQTTDWSRPRFATRVVDPRTGSIHVPIVDLNGDGKLDFVVLLSQEHEAVVAYLGDGKGNFRKETIYTAPHPGFGSSSIELVDVDRDGDLDVVYAHGDVLGKPFVLKPYQGIYWLKNQGTFPFEAHRLSDMPGIQRAVAGDVDGDGDIDIIGVSYLPAEEFKPVERDLDAVLLLEQKEKGKFLRRRLETRTCDHFTCALGDLYGTGRLNLVVGNFYSSKSRPLPGWVTIWK